MGLFSKKVAVTLIDDAAEAVFATTQMAPADLPESFAIHTTLHIGDDDWSVVDAMPKTREEYAKSGALVLRLRRIERMDPAKILYSLPSICDRIPPVENGVLPDDALRLHEDDWRQLEFVSRRFASAADAEIEAIRRIYNEESVGVGFRTIHVRQEPIQPIVGDLKRSNLNDAFGGQLRFGALGYRGCGSPIPPGFSFRADDGMQCYGLNQGAQIIVLGIAQTPVKPPTVRSAEVLADLARQFELDLVNWCRCARASWDLPLFSRLLIGEAVD